MYYYRILGYNKAATASRDRLTNTALFYTVGHHAYLVSTLHLLLYLVSAVYLTIPPCL